MLRQIFIRLGIAATAALLFFGIAAMGGSWGYVFHKSVNYNEVYDDALGSNVPIEGDAFWVDYIVSNCTERTNKDTGNVLSSTVDSHYYVLPFDIDNNELILLLTKEGSETEKRIDELYNVLWGDTEDVHDYLEDGVHFEGLLLPVEDDVLPYYEDWQEEYDMGDYHLAPYYIDCHKDFATGHQMFLEASIELGAAVVLIALMIWAGVSGHKKAKAAPAPQVFFGDGTPVFDQSDVSAPPEKPDYPDPELKL